MNGHTSFFHSLNFFKRSEKIAVSNAMTRENYFTFEKLALNLFED